MALISWDQAITATKLSRALLLFALVHQPDDRSVLVGWDDLNPPGVSNARTGGPLGLRDFAMLQSCAFDAWAAYDDTAIGTQLAAALRRPPGERSTVNKERTISFATFRALDDVLPVGARSDYFPLMKRLGYDPSVRSVDIETPAGIGNVACAAVLEFRHHDKSNQLGDLAQGAYADWTGYRPVNPPGTVPERFPFAKPLNPNHWQPLTYVDSSGNLVLQMFVAAQWPYVTPFALSSADEFRSTLRAPPAYGTPGYQRQAEELLVLSTNLTDEQKMIAEYWTVGNDSQAAEHWLRFAQFVSERDHYSLDDDVKMYFALSNAMFDASIAAFDAKRASDSVRPVTAISLLFQGKKIRAWGGPGKGTVEIDGSQWIPYQPATSPTPPSPGYVSLRSAVSAAAARILALWTGSDRFGYSVTLPTGSSQIEPGKTPAQQLTLTWDTFSAAANQAGMAGRYAGVSFSGDDLAGRQLGRLAADKAWAKAQSLFNGSTPPKSQTDIPAVPSRP